MSDVIDRVEALPPRQRAALRARVDSGQAGVNIHPLSSAQQRMWFLDRMYPGSPLYTVPFAFELTGRLDAPALVGVLHELVRRHESLRTAFFDIDGVPYQTIQEESTFAPTVRRWREQDAERPELVRRLLDAEARRTFDLRRGPLLSATVLTSGETGRRHLLLLTMHHIVCDGWSVTVLFGEIERAYAAAVEGRAALLPPLPVRYVDFARWQVGQVGGPRFEAHLDHWCPVLADPPPPPVWQGRARPERTADGAMEMAIWPAALARAVEAFSRAEGVTPFITMLTVFAELVRRHTGATDLVVGTPVANRTRIELEGLVGFFVNMLPLRLAGTGSEGLRAAAQRVRRVTVAAQSHQELPFELIVEALGVPRDGGNPLFEVAFVVQEPETEQLRLAGLDVAIVIGHNDTAKFDLTGTCTLSERGLEAMLEFRRSVLQPAEVRALLQDFRGLLEAALAAPERPFEDLTCAVRSEAEVPA